MAGPGCLADGAHTLQSHLCGPNHRHWVRHCHVISAVTRLLPGTHKLHPPNAKMRTKTPMTSNSSCNRGSAHCHTPKKRRRTVMMPARTALAATRPPTTASPSMCLRRSYRTKASAHHGICMRIWLRTLCCAGSCHSGRATNGALPLCAH